MCHTLLDIHVHINSLKILKYRSNYSSFLAAKFPVVCLIFRGSMNDKFCTVCIFLRVKVLIS